MRDFVLINIKSEIENGNWYVEDPKAKKKNKVKDKINDS